MEEKIIKKVLKNEWLSGRVDVLEGDLFAGIEQQKIFSKIMRVEDIKKLYEYLNTYDGVFIYKTIVFANSWKYGTFVYAILENGEVEEFEHLTMEAISFKEFKKIVSRFLKIRNEEDIIEYFKN